MKKDLPIFVSNHHDLMWRRCFDRPLSFRGENYVSYATLQALYIIENIEICKKHPEYKFTVECVAVLKKFLSDHPEYREIIGEYLKDGRIHMPATGHNITDTNLINGESIIRSYLYGYDYLKKNFDFVPTGVDRNDTFGNSAQIPQIVRGFGDKWVTNVVYTKMSHPYWRGLDGSVICQVDPIRAATYGGYAKYRPCPACKGIDGAHCEKCNDQRIDRDFIEARRSHIRINENAPQTEELQGIIYISGEEILPDESIFSWIEENKEKYNIFFSDFPDVAERYYSKRIAAVDAPPEEEVSPALEMNFNNTGCYVTRIKAKQAVRKEESRIYAAESLAVMNMLCGKSIPDFEPLWDKMLFTMFHDAVTGTMVDAAYNELMDIHADIDRRLTETEETLLSLCTKAEDGVLTVINPNPAALCASVKLSLPEGKILLSEDGERIPVMHSANEVTAEMSLAPFGQRHLRLADGEYKKEVYSFKEAGETILAPVLRNEETGEEEICPSDGNFVIENEFYKVTASKNGITEIFDKRLCRAVCEESEYKVGEWILEHDEGSPWATLSDDRRRFKLSEQTSLVSLEKTDDAQTLTFEINRRYWAYTVDSGYDIKYSVTLVRGTAKVLFSADVFWNSQNFRLRVAFPTAAQGRHVYEIPYGHIERAPYAPNCVWPNGTSNWASANGDMPAFNWAGVEGEDMSVILLNRGTPSYQIDRDAKGKENIFLSVLRSPSVGTYLHEPLSYTMTDYDGMRDEGEHHFEFAIASYDKGFSENDAVLHGIGYNAQLYAVNGTAHLPEMPSVISDDVRISAVKPAADGTGFVYRLAEFHGKDSKAEISVPAGLRAVYDCNMKEEPIEELPIHDGRIALPVGHFKIKTIKFVL